MTASALADGPTRGANDTASDDLFAHLLSANPFTDNRVNGPAPDGADVDDIHRAGFERLTALANEACRLRRGLGVVLWGEPGIGKSHVLARLGRWADVDGPVPFVYLHNLQASPEGLPRSVLRAVVSILTAGRSARFRGTPLFRLVASFAHEAFDYDPSVRPPWHAVERAYGRLVERERPGLVERTAYAVLFRFFLSAYRVDEGHNNGVAPLAVRWLAGDYLDPSEAARLRLPPGPARDEPVGLADNQQVKQVLVVLARLAQSARRPLLLGFDQVDNLDDAQMAALARFLEALLDTAPNLLVVTAGVQATLMHWRQTGQIQESAWHRLAQFEVALQRVTPAEAERIVAVRLACFLAPCRGRAALPQDALFPLGQAWLAEALRSKIDVRPRDVINWAREGLAREQEALCRAGGPAWLAMWGRQPLVRPDAEPEADPLAIQAAIDRCVLQEVLEQRAQRLAHPETLPPDADNLSGLVGALLEQCRALGPPYAVAAVQRPAASPRSGPRAAHDLLLRRRSEEGEERSRLLFLVTTSATSAAASLRRLTEAPERDGRTFLVTDQRLPLELGARGREYLEALRDGDSGRFQHVELTFADYIDLDSLQAVVGLARSGDLERNGPGGASWPVSEAETLQSLHRQGCYRSAPLLRDLLAERTPAAAVMT